MTTAITQMIDKVKLAERQSDIQRKSLTQIEEEILKVQASTQLLKDKTQELNLSYQTKLEELSSKETDSKIAEQNEIILKEILTEKELNLQNEQIALEGVQRNVWNDREKFCDAVHKFTEEHGILAFLRRVEESSNQTKPSEEEIEETSFGIHASTIEMPKFAKDPELAQLKAEVAALQTQLVAEEKEPQELLTRSQVAEQERSRLLKEPTTGNEFMRLQESLRLSKEQTDAVEIKCESVQADIFRLEQMLQQNILFNRSLPVDAPTPAHAPAAAPRHLRNSTLDTWLQSALGKEGSEEAELPAESALTPSTAHAEEPDDNRLPAKLAASTSFKKQISCGTFQEEKSSGKVFIPKRQSAVSMRLQNNKRLAMTAQDKLKEFLKKH